MAYGFLFPLMLCAESLGLVSQPEMGPCIVQGICAYDMSTDIMPPHELAASWT